MELTENQKRFARIIKEIGLWHIWYKERKERMHYRKDHSLPVTHFIPDRKNFSNVVTSSFVFRETSNPMLWSKIYDYAYSDSITNEELVKNEVIYKKFKRHINKLINNLC